MNFTLASPESAKDIETLLGGALTDRFTHKIYFAEPSSAESYEYVIELMDYYRTRKLEKGMTDGGQVK
jgi:hypothetical protein